LGITFQPGEHAVRVEATLAADELPDLRRLVRLRQRLRLRLERSK